MKSLNRVTLLGHVAADPELKTTKTGKPVLSFAIATNNEWFDTDGVAQKSVDFHRIVAWEKLAELCARHLRKGSPLFLEGRLTNRSYEGQDQLKHYITEVVLHSVHIFDWGHEKKEVETKELAAV